MENCAECDVICVLKLMKLGKNGFVAIYAM